MRYGSVLSTDAKRAHRQRCCRGPVLHPELGEDLLQVFVHGARAETQNFRDVPVGLAAGDPKQHLSLAIGDHEAALEHGLIAAGVALDDAKEPLLRTHLTDIE